MGDIWDYTAERWSIEQADRYTDEIREACAALAAGSKRGRAVEIRRGYLKYPVSAHLLYFRIDGDRIEIMRVLHQRMDVSRHL